MSTTSTTAQATRLTTCLVRFSYLKVFKAEAVGDSDELKFSVALLVPKSDKAGVKAIETAIATAVAEGKTTKFGGKTGGLKLPLRDGDVEKPDDENYAGMWFINANCKTKPGIVDKNLQAIISPEDIKSGDWGKANVTFYPFVMKGNKGVACGLNHLQKIKDGEALGGNIGKPEDAFDVEDEEDYSFLD